MPQLFYYKTLLKHVLFSFLFSFCFGIKGDNMKLTPTVTDHRSTKTQTQSI